jgi:iron complex outermembrane recepter protein
MLETSRNLGLKSGVALIALVAAAPLLAQGPAPSPAAENEGVTDIIVTAQRRAENVQDVPISISAFSSDQLRSQGVSSALELGNFVPNLIAQNNTGVGSANAYFLRGLGSTETIPTFDPPVGTYVDDVYLSRQNANNLNLFDVERVEVLRGPQGTLFGRNTTGGAINVILREPGKEFDGYAEIGYGRYNKKLIRGSVDIPLAPTFSVKLSGYWQDDDGYVKNTTTGESLNDDDGWGARIGIHGDLGANVRWNASYAHIVANGENILNYDCNPANATDCSGRFATTGLRQTQTGSQFAGLAVPIAGVKANFPLGNFTTSELVTSKLDWDIGTHATLTAITGYLSQSQKYALDFFDGRAGPSLNVPNPPVTGNARGGFVIINDGLAQQFSQEVKLTGSIGDKLIDYVAGVYYIKEDVRTDFADVFAGSLTLGDRILFNSTEAIAGYAQGDLNLGQFKFTAGIRYTDEVKKIHFQDNRPACQLATAAVTCLFDQNFVVPANGTTIPAAVAIPLRQQVKVWTPRFALNWKPSDNILLFVSATKGFKSGGWNARATTAQGVLPFGPETVWSYEGGVKAELFDRRLRANISVYQEDVSDLQILSAGVSATGALAFSTRNFANYRNRGVEAEFTIVPVKGLNLFVNVGYQDDKYILKNQPAFDQYGFQSVADQLAACRAALAAGKIPTGPNTPATLPPISACANGIVTAQGTISSPVRTPDITLSLGGSYRAEVGGGYSIVPSVAASYHSSQEVSIANLTVYTGAITGTNGTFAFNPNSGTPVIGSFSPAAWLVNAGLALNAPSDRWQLSVQCTNCFDKAYTQSALSNTTYLNPPMSWQIRARYNFK